jgi:tRNA wybutosine-synthesizing protein 3
MHVIAATPSKAQVILAIAQQAGFRESGIMSLGDCPVVAIRSIGLAFDSIVAFENAEGTLVPLVDEVYLRTLVLVANERFTINRERIERLAKGITTRPAMDYTSHTSTDQQEATARRELNKREGLAKQQAQRLIAGPKHDDALHEQDRVELSGLFDD